MKPRARRRTRVAVAAAVWLLTGGVAAQHSGGSFGGSRGFGGGSSRSSSGGGSSSSSFGGGSSSSSSSAARREADEARRRDERIRAQEAERARAERERMRREAEERERLERERLERERLERELALPSEERARSDRFGGAYERAPWAAPAPTATVERTGGAALWWGAPAPLPMFERERRWEVGAGLYAFAALAVLGVGAMARRARRRWQSAPVPTAAVPSAKGPRATVAWLSVGVDWTRRADVQRALAAQAEQRDVSTAAGMFAAWCDVRAVLQGALGAVRYAGWGQEVVAVGEAQRRFDAIADDVRGRYVVETVRDRARVELGPMDARREEGGGFVVVTVVVGTLGAAPSLPRMDIAGAVGVALPQLAGSAPDALVALQTVWSPTQEDDRLSSAELEALYPMLRRLDGGVGRVQCAHCGAVWARELGACPACGAPPAQG